MTVRFFEIGCSSDERACQLWQVLVGLAVRRETTTYTKLAEHIDQPQVRALQWALGRIMYFCQQNRLPPLTLLVVNKNTGHPGPGFELDADEGRERERVFKYEWYKLVPPTVEQYGEAYENRG